MKNILVALLVIGMGSQAMAQTKKVKEKDLEGIWQMRIVMDDDFLEKEKEEEDNVFARMIIQATGAFVEGILGEIKIKMEFQKDGVCKVYASAFDEDDVSETSWFIKDGKLYIDDVNTMDFGDDDYWMFEDDVLVLRNSDGSLDDEANVYMVRMD